jgi:hypothetical protein
MARFFVGQRVRLARPVHPENAGMTGRLVALFPNRNPFSWMGGLEHNCEVMWDRKPSRGYACDTAQLEPIQPSGHRASDFSFHELMDKCRQGEGVEA